MSDAFTIPTSAMQPAGGANAAGMGRRLQMWRPANQGPNSVAVSALPTIRGRSRDAARNDPWTGSASDKLVTNMVGTGILARCLNGSKERKLAHSKIWNRWVEVCDADSIVNLYGLQALALREWDEVGECFARLRQRRLKDGFPVPLQVQLLPAEMCPTDLNRLEPNGNETRLGIEYNLIGARVAYWFYRRHPFDYTARTFGQSELVRVPAEEILHMFEPLRIGQVRGIPRTISTLTLLYNIGRLNDSKLERAAVQNLFTVFFTEDGDGVGGDDPIDPESVSNPSDDPGANIVGLEPGSAQKLPRGWKAEFPPVMEGGSEYAAFMRSQLLGVAARHGVPYEVLTGDLNGVSDRALRLILNEFRRMIEHRTWLYMVPQFLQPIRKAFYNAGVMSGLLDCPGYADDPEEYTDTVWMPQGWPYSHPVQDVTADSNAVRNGFTSRQAIIQSNGEDAEDVDAQIAEDNARADANGFVFDSDPRKVSNSGLTQARPGGTTIPSPDIDPEDDDPPQPNNGNPNKPPQGGNQPPAEDEGE